MTQRVAIILSIALTLVVSAGVFAGRDRLFAPESAASSYTATSSAAPSPGDRQSPEANQAGQLTRTTPRIVTVPLPPTLTTSSASTQARGERGEGSFDNERDDHDRVNYEGYEHDEEYDDD